MKKTSQKSVLEALKLPPDEEVVSVLEDPYGDLLRTTLYGRRGNANNDNKQSKEQTVPKLLGEASNFTSATGSMMLDFAIVAYIVAKYGWDMRDDPHRAEKLESAIFQAFRNVIFPFHWSDWDGHRTIIDKGLNLVVGAAQPTSIMSGLFSAVGGEITFNFGSFSFNTANVFSAACLILIGADVIKAGLKLKKWSGTDQDGGPLYEIPRILFFTLKRLKKEALKLEEGALKLDLRQKTNEVVSATTEVVSAIDINVASATNDVVSAFDSNKAQILKNQVLVVLHPPRPQKSISQAEKAWTGPRKP